MHFILRPKIGKKMTPQENKFSKRSRNQALLEKFSNEYNFILAKTASEKNKALLLRHAIFLQELNYEMHEDQTKKYETDEYDNTSIHCLIEHKKSGLPAGCMRLVIPSSDPTSKLYRLPVEIQGEQKLNHRTLHPSLMSKIQLCEVSRLAISRHFRPRQQDKNQLDVVFDGYNFSTEETETFPLIAIGLFLCTYSLVGLSGRQHVYAMMEPRLPKLLSLSGFHFTQVSEVIEYHGSRHAYYIDHTKTEKEMHEDLMPLYLYIRRALEPQLKELLATTDSSSIA